MLWNPCKTGDFDSVNGFFEPKESIFGKKIVEQKIKTD